MILRFIKADAKNAASAETATVFPVGSYVLCRYTDRPPTRLHTKWHGPYCIVSFKGSEYVLANLVNHKKRSVHVKNLKIFNYDPEVEYRSMLNGSTTMILIIHGSRGNHYGSVKHSMIIYVIIK